MIFWAVTITDLPLNLFFSPGAPPSMPRREIPTPFHPITASFQAALQACDKRNLRLQEPFSCSYVAIQQKCPKTTGFCCLQSFKYTMFNRLYFIVMLSLFHVYSLDSVCIAWISFTVTNSLKIQGCCVHVDSSANFCRLQLLITPLVHRYV